MQPPLREPGPSEPLEPRVNILLVDDRRENLVALTSVLEELGQNLVTASSGREALKQLLTTGTVGIPKASYGWISDVLSSKALTNVKSGTFREVQLYMVRWQTRHLA